jgi:hypothetical protein
MKTLITLIVGFLAGIFVMWKYPAIVHNIYQMIVNKIGTF